jgi:hypothetical protein
MRENRPYGSEGGGTESNRSFLPLSSGSECGELQGLIRLRASTPSGHGDTP